MVQAPAMSVVPKPSPAFGTIRASKKRLDRTETDKSPRPACTSAILRTDSSAELARKPQEIRAVSYTFYGGHFVGLGAPGNTRFWAGPELKPDQCGPKRRKVCRTLLFWLPATSVGRPVATTF